MWDAISDSPAEALNLKLRAGVLVEIQDRLRESGWTQAEAAKQMGITQPRVSDLLSGKISKFSLDTLVNMLAMLGGEIELRVA